MSRIIAICNQKGGVGKTTTSVNLGAALALAGKKVLLVDFDPQANATVSLGYALESVDKNVYHGVLNEETADNLIKPTVIFNFHFIPANSDLSGLSVELVNMPNREFYLNNFIENIEGRYDYILIDLPPSLSLLTVNGLVAATEVLVPIQSEYLSIEGLGQLLETVDLINKNLNRNIKISGAVLTMHDEARQYNRDVAGNVRNHFPYPVFKTEIPRCASLSEAPSFGRPAVLYDSKSIGSQAYEKLAKEIMESETAAVESVNAIKSNLIS